MTALNEFLAGRGPAEMYEDYWVPCTLWPHAVSLAEKVSPGDKVLDVGAGTGLLTELASARVGVSGHVSALEPTPFMIDLLHKKYDGVGRINIVEKSIEEADLPENSFDVLLCHQVVQYINDLPSAIAQMRRVLKPGGILVVGVWSGPKDQVVSVLEDGFGKHLGDSYVPIHAWSFGGLDRLKSLAEDAGFLIETLEKQVKTARFASVKELLDVHLTGGMRVADGEVFMGIFDLADDSFSPKVKALLSDLRESLAKFEGTYGMALPWASDVLVAKA
jgi:ubiquinone/menaquinone biosynthesis C-methylase UbiE